jgi:hypothetical protein
MTNKPSRETTHLQTEDAFESVKTKTDEPGIIRGVKLLGLRSRNKRNYDTPGVRDSGLKLMEGVQVYIDHPEKADTPRSYRDKFGQIRNVRYEAGKGHFGDLHYNPKHQAAEQFLWDVENSPSTQGFSINSKIKPGKTDRSGDVIVESLEIVRSVDIVAKPATNSGIFESESPVEDEVMDLETLKKNHPDLFKQVVKEALGSDASESEIEMLKKQHAEAMEQLAEFRKKDELKQLRDAVEADFAEVFKHSAFTVEIQKEILECACEMAEATRKKMKGVVSKLSPMLIEVPDEEDDELELPAKEQEEEDEKKPVKAPYKPGKRSSSGGYSFMESVGLSK